MHTLHVGGAEVLAREFALRAQESCRAVFACLDELGSLGEELQSRGFPVEVLQRRPGFDWRCARRLARLCRRERVDVLHAHQYGPFFYAALARAWGPRLPILFLEHGRDWPDYRRPKRVFANKLLLRKQDRIVAVGECVRQALIAYEGLPPDRIEVIYNGVDLTRYDPQCAARAEVRRMLQATPEDLVIFQVARLNRLKDHATALHTLAELRRQTVPAKLILVGDGEERANVERLMDELGLRQCVTLLGTRADVPWLLQGADTFLLTSVSEGIPLTLIEAMATGLPCVATCVGGVPEVIVEGTTGFLSEAGNAMHLAASIQRLHRDPELARRLGAAGRARAERLFDDRQMHAAYQRLYLEMATGRAAVAP